MVRNGWLIVSLALLLAGCTMLSARQGDPAGQVVASPTPAGRATAQPSTGAGTLPPTPTQEQGYGAAQYVVERAIADLQGRLDIRVEQVTVQEVVPTDFPDASLGVPEPDTVYAQVVTPGYVIRLAAEGEVYEYHGSGDRVVLAPDLGGPPMPPLPGQGTYHRVEVADVGLSFEVPDGWLRLEPEWAWTPQEGSELRLGLNWVDLQPPMEPEAVLLPGPSQILFSEEVALSWGQGRRFLLEVYAPTVGGGDARAPVASVESHVLVVVPYDGARRAFDLYARGATLEDLDALAPLLQRALDTSVLADTTAGSMPSPTSAEAASPG